jgi:hypothetical protein
MLRTILPVAAVALASVAGTACYSTQPYDYEGHDSNATIVVYRRADLNLAALSTFVAVDDRPIVALRNDSYVAIQLSPGRHELRLNASNYPNGATVVLDVEDLDWLYFEAEPNPANLASATAAAATPSAVGLGVALGSLFMKPFLLRPSDAEEFGGVVDRLERMEPEDGVK